ncbi:MAG: hypothetical protein ACKVOX_07270 [Rhizobacter sp.]
MSRWFPEHAVLRLVDLQPHAIESDLDGLSLRRGTRLTCVLAGEGVRYGRVPWSDDLSSPSQRQLLAQQSFVETHGEAARGWTVRQHTAGHGAASLACAIDPALLERIDALVQARRWKLVSVQPSLVHAYNEARRRIPSTGLFWFAEIDEERATVLLMSPTEPLQVKRLPSAGADLTQWLDREWFALGMEAPRCPVYVVRTAPGVAHVAMSAASRRTGGRPEAGWQIVDLGVLGATGLAAQGVGALG